MIFDDIFSPLDAKTSSFIMNETILGVLKETTVLIITHAVQYAKTADCVYVMEKGEIIQKGDYEDVKENELFQKFNQLEEVKKK